MFFRAVFPKPSLAHFGRFLGIAFGEVHWAHQGCNGVKFSWLEVRGPMGWLPPSALVQREPTPAQVAKALTSPGTGKGKVQILNFPTPFRTSEYLMFSPTESTVKAHSGIWLKFARNFLVYGFPQNCQKSKYHPILNFLKKEDTRCAAEFSRARVLCGNLIL